MSWLTILTTLKKINLKWMMLIIIIIMGVVICLGWNRLQVIKKDRIRLSDNFEAYIHNTHIRVNKKDKEIAERDALILKDKELINISDSLLQLALSELKDNEIKIRDTRSLLVTQFKLNEKLRTKIHYDSIFYNSDINLDTGYFYVRSTDTAQIGSLKIIRVSVLGNDSADYTISYSPIVYVTVSEYKEGKWKIVNLFKRRNKITKATVSSNDNILKPKEVIYVEKR